MKPQLLQMAAAAKWIGEHSNELVAAAVLLGTFALFTYNKDKPKQRRRPA